MVVKFTATFAKDRVSGKHTSESWAVVRSQRGMDFTLALAVIWHIIKTLVPCTVHNKGQEKKNVATLNLQFSFFSKGYNIKDRNSNYLDVLKQNDFARQG